MASESGPKKLTPKERMKIPRQSMPAEDPNTRRHDFHEVNLGFTTALAVKEAQRCIECKKPGCIQGCPVHVHIREFVALVAEERFEEAAQIIKQDNSLPAICGRVCPQEEQCEHLCVLGKKGDPVAIGHLERFVADWERNGGGLMTVQRPEPTGKRVAVVGSGPAGLSCATDLVKQGHVVTVFEALHELGGVLVYGIPEFRLPKEIVHAEIRQLEKLGVEFQTNVVIGQTVTIDELFGEEGFDAVFLGVGAGLPRFLNVPGENLVGVYSSNEFLTRVNLMKAYCQDSDTPVIDLEGRNVAVFGAGNTAMDAVRTALRLGAKTARIIYRRSADEMPARKEEIHHAKEEGVEFVLLHRPLEFVGDAERRLRHVRLQQMELGPPDDSGRRRPVPIEGNETTLDIDLAVVAIGNEANPMIQKSSPEIEHTKWGTIQADDETCRTSRRGVFAGGDIVTGGATVILAMGAGRRAAASIDEYLRTGAWEAEPDVEAANADSNADANAGVKAAE